jgi:hypothetical protein
MVHPLAVFENSQLTERDPQIVVVEDPIFVGVPSLHLSILRAQ